MFGFTKKRSASPSPAGDGSLRHIAFIMDGNGRWAQARSMPREYGHSVGAGVFSEITEYCGDIGIDTVTVYAFSTENWKRPQKEVDAIISLFSEYIKKASDTMMKRNIRIIFPGSREPFSDALKEQMTDIERRSANNAKTLNVAINYGGRDEIIYAANEVVRSGADRITPELLEEKLYTHASPPPDLIVRTGGELRLSNFMLWQAAYSELYFTDVLWPDFKKSDVDKAVAEFYSRKRRFGGI